MADKIKPGNIKTYRGNLSLDWYGKDYSIIQGEESENAPGMVPPPRLNWVNKDGALFYEIDESQGKGVRPVWVKRGDIRVHEARPLVHVKTYTAVPKKTADTLGLEGDTGWEVQESEEAPEDPLSGNILIKGDNLLALNTLKQMFAGRTDSEKVKCIYIDPPYNTGNAFSKYDDNLNNSEWLTLIRDRLVILGDLLRQDGYILVSIDEDEFGLLKPLMDEVFQSRNFINYLVWEKKDKPSYLSQIGTKTEIILAYAKERDICAPFYFGETTAGKMTPINNAGNGLSTLTFKAGKVRFNFTDRLIQAQDMSGGNIITKLLCDVEIKDYRNTSDFILEGEFRYSQSTLNQLMEGGEDIYISKLPFRPNHIKRGGEDKKIHNFLTKKTYDIGTYEDSEKESRALFGDDAFPYPKPESLISFLITIGTDEGDLVLDSFLGSGTTAAVSHKNGRRWIGIEVGDQCELNCLKRIHTVLSRSEPKILMERKYPHQGGGSFSYYHLGESILKLDAEGYADLNWSAGREWLESSILSAYDFKSVKAGGDGLGLEISCIGSRPVRGGSEAAIVSLWAPGEDEGRQMLGRREWEGLYAAARKLGNKVFLFTNRGLELAEDSKPEDLVVVRVPEALCTAESQL